jgi:hypothetical protein
MQNLHPIIFLIEEGYRKKRAVCVTLRLGEGGYNENDCARMAKRQNRVLAKRNVRYRLTIRHGNLNRENKFEARNPKTDVFTIFFSKSTRLPRTAEEVLYS